MRRRAARGWIGHQTWGPASAARGVGAWWTGDGELAVLAKRLAGGRALYPTVEMTQAEGWRPRGDDDFDR